MHRRTSSDALRPRWRRTLTRLLGPVGVIAASALVWASMSEPASRPPGPYAWPFDPPEGPYFLGNNNGQVLDWPGFDPVPHDGIDVLENSPRKVYAMAEGDIVLAVLDPSDDWQAYIVIETSSGRRITYAHLRPRSVEIPADGHVLEGAYLGEVADWPDAGDPGTSPGDHVFPYDHLHLAVLDPGTSTATNRVNPLTLIASSTDSVSPKIENARGGQQFLFCRNRTSTSAPLEFLSPDALKDEQVDVVARVYDKFQPPGSTTDPPRLWKMIPYSLVLTIDEEATGDQVFRSVIRFDGELWENELCSKELIKILYAQHAPAESHGNWARRQFFFVVTNSNDDDLYCEDGDLHRHWDTSGLTGKYTITLVVEDHSGASDTARMSVDLGS